MRLLGPFSRVAIEVDGKDMDRRLFLALATATSAARGLAGAASMSSPPIGQARKPSNFGDSNLIINALGQLGNPNPQPSDQVPTKSHPTPVTESASVGERVIREAHASGLTAVTLTLGYTAGEMDPFEFTVRDVAHLDSLIRANSRDLVKIFYNGRHIKSEIRRQDWAHLWLSERGDGRQRRNARGHVR